MRGLTGSLFLQCIKKTIHTVFTFSGVFMFRFFLKKNFCDVWDNLFYLILTNLVPIAVIVGSCFAISASASVNSYLPNIVFIICSGLFMTVLFAWGANARKIADFNSPRWSLFLSSLKNCFFTGFIFGALLAVLLLVVRIAFLYYLGMYAKSENLVSVLFAAIIAWFFFIVVMALQWFVPLYFLQEDNTFGKNLKKSFIVYFDNAGFSFLMLIHNLLLLALTLLTFGLIPGFNGITLSCTNACRLRLYKYDWFEEHPEYLEDKEMRSNIPWDELIAGDRESLGDRKLSSFLFPWK